MILYEEVSFYYKQSIDASRQARVDFSLNRVESTLNLPPWCLFFSFFFFFFSFFSDVALIRSRNFCRGNKKDLSSRGVLRRGEGIIKVKAGKM